MTGLEFILAAALYFAFLGNLGGDVVDNVSEPTEQVQVES
tara:strand:- start:5472 stop:5591 length:120 start_codon:yes stop_codon:yes gene_type:complete